MKWHSLYLVLILGLILALAKHWLYPAANGNDLYPRWYGTHVLFHGGDPYGRQVTEESERHNYGHVLSANLRSSGVAERVIMRIGGWEMRSVFERYAIITNCEVQDAAQRLEDRRGQLGAKPSESVRANVSVPAAVN
jgi:hypothetical protein